MNSLHHLIYQSTAVTDLSGAELGRLLQQSRFHNQAAGITGILLYDGSRFLQVLEGEKWAVDAVFGRILLDCRHTDVQVLANGRAEPRQFSGWSMGLVSCAAGVWSGADDARPVLQQVTDTALGLLLHDFLLHAGRSRRYLAA